MFRGETKVPRTPANAELPNTKSKCVASNKHYCTTSICMDLHTQRHVALISLSLHSHLWISVLGLVS